LKSYVRLAYFLHNNKEIFQAEINDDSLDHDVG